MHSEIEARDTLEVYSLPSVVSKRSRSESPFEPHPVSNLPFGCSSL